jgi:cytochrome bd-type quinol oxidase subunit 2
MIPKADRQGCQRPNTAMIEITWLLIASAVIALVLVVLVQGKWTSQDSWFAAVFATALMAMVIGHYVSQMY